MTQRQFLRPLFLLLPVLALVGCTTATPYQPALDGYGYTTTRIEDDRFRIGFSGNSQTPREVVENYLLYRAAEVTLEVGGDHFTVVNRDSDSLVSYRTTSTGGWPYWSAGWGWSGSRGVGIGVESARSTPIPRYQALAEIRVGLGPKPDEDTAFDARQVIANLEPGIVRPAAAM